MLLREDDLNTSEKELMILCGTKSPLYTEEAHHQPTPLASFPKDGSNQAARAHT